ncbi:MAG: hypothetical protein QM778_34685 [Myxococcales bacterium]
MSARRKTRNKVKARPEPRRVEPVCDGPAVAALQPAVAPVGGRDDARKSLRGPLLRFTVVLLLGLWIWQPLRPPLTQAFSHLANVTLGELTLGSGGHIDVQPARATSQEISSWDTVLTLRVEGIAQAHSVRVNPRRLLYLPVTVLVALVMAVPFEPRRRWRALALGLPVLAMSALVCVWITAAWVFSRVPDLVYPASQAAWVAWLYESWVTPLANKFLLPLALMALFYTCSGNSRAR